MHGFPAALTSFIGRDEPLREATGLLQGHRLVTVTGPGVRGRPGWPVRWPGGRRASSPTGRGWWSWRRCRTRAQVAGVVAAALGVREQPGIPAAEAVARVLARQQLLLVLDNCEYVIGEAARLCAKLPEAAGAVAEQDAAATVLRLVGSLLVPPQTRPDGGESFARPEAARWRGCVSEPAEDRLLRLPQGAGGQQPRPCGQRGGSQRRRRNPADPPHRQRQLGRPRRRSISASRSPRPRSARRSRNPASSAR